MFWCLLHHLQGDHCATCLKTMCFSQTNTKTCQQKLVINTGCFIMFSMITNVYNKKTKGPTLMELFTATGKLKKFFFDNSRFSTCAPRVTQHTSIRYSSSCHTCVNMLTCMWQELEYRIDVCHVTHGAHIEHL
jgi:hypothetical protein